LAAEETKKRRKSWWLLVIFVLAVLVGGGLFLYRRSRPRHEVLYQMGMLYLRSGNTEDAIRSFRSALENKPDYRRAQVAIVRAFAARREFPTAHEELDKAERMGLGELESGLLRAELYAMRGDHRILAAGESVDVALCDSIIEEDIEPAIQLIEKYADESQRPAVEHSRVGDLYTQKSRILATKWRLLREARDLARDLQHDEEAAARQTEALAAIPRIGETQRMALMAYSRAIELDSTLDLPRLALARHMLSTYVPRPKGARAVLEPLIEADPQHRAARMLIAGAERLAGNYEKALEHLNAIPQEEEEDFDLLQEKTQVLVDMERWQEAGLLTEKLILLRQHDPYANFLRGLVLMHDGNYELAASRLQNIFARTKGPWPRARLALAQALQQGGRREQAITAFKTVLDDVSTVTVTNVRLGQDLQEVRYDANLALAEEFATGMPYLAAEHAEKAFKVFPDREEGFEAAKEGKRRVGAPPEEIEDIVLLYSAARAGAGDFEGAVSVCDRAIQEFQAEGLGYRTRLHRARLLATGGSFGEAADAYRELWETTRDSVPAYELAALHMRLGRVDEARKVYERLLEADRADMSALTGLLRVMLQQGDVAGARALLQRTVEETSSDRVRGLLMGLHARGGRTEDAVTLARSLVESNPQDGAAHVVLGRLLWRAGKTEEARAAFDRALEVSPEYLGGYVRGLLDLQMGRTKDAIALFTDACARFPGELAPVLHLAIALQMDGRLGEAVELLEGMLKPETAARREAGALPWHLAVMYTAQGRTEAAIEQSNRFLSPEFGLPQDRVDLLQRLGALKEPQRGDAASALNLALSFRRTGNLHAALEALESVKQLLAEDDPLLACWRCEILENEGKREEAVEGYEGIIRENPNFLYARIRLADAHTRRGDVQPAVTVLEGALGYATEQEAAVIHFYLAMLYEGQQRFDEAISSYEAAMKYRPRAPHAMNNVAWILAVYKDDPSSALPLAEEALRVGGPRPEVLDTLGWIHCLKGNADEAVKYLEAAKTGLPHLPTVRYHLGVAYLKAGRREDARSELQEALSMSSAFAEAGDARKLLEGLQ